MFSCSSSSRSSFSFVPVSTAPSSRLQHPKQEAELASGSETETSWEGLLAAAQRGDGNAYRAFLVAILPFIRSVARSRLRNSEAVEDVVQEALLTLHRVRHTYQPGRPVRPWLAAIVSRRAIDAARRRGRIQARETFDPAGYETFADPTANRVDRADSAQQLARMMAELTPRQKEALELVKLREMSLAEASTASGRSVASLKVNVHRAIQRLRRNRSERGE
jgi:RNA polymerase sigma-70 factor (ECF subfamily)